MSSLDHLGSGKEMMVVFQTSQSSKFWKPTQIAFGFPTFSYSFPTVFPHFPMVFLWVFLWFSHLCLDPTPAAVSPNEAREALAGSAAPAPAEPSCAAESASLGLATDVWRWKYVMMIWDIKIILNYSIRDIYIYTIYIYIYIDISWYIMKYHEYHEISWISWNITHKECLRDECGNTVEEILHQLVAVGNYETL